MTRLLRWLDRLPNWLRAGVITGAFVALPGFFAALADALDDIASWAAGETVALPDLSALRVAAVAVVFGGIAGGLNAAFRWSQEWWSKRTGKPVGNPPIYPTRAHTSGDRGQVSPGTAILLLVAVLLMIVVLRGTGTC